MMSFRDLLEEHIRTHYEGSAAAMSRETGFSTTTISAWRRGKVALPQIETRRQLAKELGISHIELLVSMQELDPSEANIPEDPRSPAVKRLSQAIDRYEWNENGLETAERLISTVGDLYAGSAVKPDLESK